MKRILLSTLTLMLLMVGCNSDYDLDQTINLKMSLLQGELGLPLTTTELTMDSIIQMVDFGPHFSEQDGLYKIKYEADLESQVIDAPEVEIPKVADFTVNEIASKAWELSGLSSQGITLEQAIASGESFDILDQENMEMAPSLFTLNLYVPSTLLKLKSVNFDNLYIIIETTLNGIKGDGRQPIASIHIESPSSFKLEGARSFNLIPTDQPSTTSSIEVKLTSIINPDDALTPPFLYQFTFGTTILPYKGLRITDSNAHATTKITIEDRANTGASNIHYDTLVGAFDITQHSSSEINISDLMRDLKGNILTHGAFLNLAIDNTTGISGILNVKAYNRDKPQNIYISDNGITINTGKDTITYGDKEITAILTDRPQNIIFDIEAQTDSAKLYTFNTTTASTIKAGYNLTVPFSFKKGSRIEVVETTKDVFNEIGDIAEMIKADLYLEAVATNKIPFEIKMKLEALDINQQSVLTLVEDVTIKAATSDTNGLSIDSQLTNISIPLTPSDLQMLKTAKDARITFELITESNSVATIRSTDRLSLKLSARKGTGGIIINPNK